MPRISGSDGDPGIDKENEIHMGKIDELESMFEDFPFDSDVQPFPDHWDMAKYLKDYADHFGITTANHHRSKTALAPKRTNETASSTANHLLIRNRFALAARTGFRPFNRHTARTSPSNLQNARHPKLIKTRPRINMTDQSPMCMQDRLRPLARH